MRKQKKEDIHKSMFLVRLIFGMAVCIIAAGCRRSPEDESTKDGVFQAAQEAAYEEQTAEPGSDESSGMIYVHVCGEVREPGLYSFDAGQRINDAIEAAGGFTDKADKEALNLATPLEDGQQIRVPDRSGSSSAADPASGTSSIEQGKAGGKVNINTASAQELASLSGIGESKAAAIISYREKQGSFSGIEDIKKVPGIGEGTYNRIKDSISV